MTSRTTVRLNDAELLRRAMAARGLTVRALAEQTPVGKSMIQHLRDGSLQTCSQRVADAIEGALGTPGLLFAAPMSTTSGQSATDGEAA